MIVAMRPELDGILTSISAEFVTPARKVDGMAIRRAVKSIWSGAGRWVQETYCAVSQKVAERLEDVSDVLAERRYLAQSGAEHPNPSPPPNQGTIEVTNYRVINGHRHSS
jgi:hypothetical protein